LIITKHAIIPEVSSFKISKSGGGWGNYLRSWRQIPQPPEANRSLGGWIPSDQKFYANFFTKRIYFWYNRLKFLLESTAKCVGVPQGLSLGVSGPFPNFAKILRYLNFEKFCRNQSL